MGTKLIYRMPSTVIDEALRMLVIERLLVQAIAAVMGVGITSVKRWASCWGIPLRKGKYGGMAITIVHHRQAVLKRPAYHRLTFDDRITIQAGLQSNPPLSVRAIAAQIGVSHSTVSREITRHRVAFGVQEPRYSAAGAHGRALVMQAHKEHRRKRLDDPWLRAYVVNALNDKYSPQQIAGRLRREFPDRKDLHVSSETIYQALYVQGRGTLRHELAVVKALRSGRTGRKPRSRLGRKPSRPWLDGVRLADRPPEADDRRVPGHWEGDLVVDGCGGGLVTLVERRSRFTLSRKLPTCSSAKSSRTVTGIVQDMIASVPEAVFSTLTWDQGSEMAEHARITVATDCEVFFCDPHSPWQRPTNENTNGLVREYYPKGTRFDSSVSDSDVQAMQDQLNRRPRKVLEYATPAEVLGDMLLAGVP